MGVVGCRHEEAEGRVHRVNWFAFYVTGQWQVLELGSLGLLALLVLLAPRRRRK